MLLGSFNFSIADTFPVAAEYHACIWGDLSNEDVFLNWHLLSLLFKFASSRHLKTISRCCRCSFHDTIVLSRYKFNPEIPVTWNSRIHLVVSVYQMEICSSSIYHLLLQKQFLAFAPMLYQYGGNLTLGIMRKIWYTFRTLLDDLLCLTEGGKILHYCYCVPH